MLQNCAMFHTVAAGSGPSDLKADHLAWVINSWNVYFDRPCDFLDTVRLSTWPHDFDRVFAHRNFTIENSRGETCVRADSVWILMQMEKQMPTRMRKELVARYETTPRLDMPPMERRVKLPRGWRPAPPFPYPISRWTPTTTPTTSGISVSPWNTCRKGSGCGGCGWSTPNPPRYRDQIHPLVRQEDGMFWVALTDGDGKSFVNLEFSESAAK